MTFLYHECPYCGNGNDAVRLTGNSSEFECVLCEGRYSVIAYESKYAYNVQQAITDGIMIEIEYHYGKFSHEFTCDSVKKRPASISFCIEKIRGFYQMALMPDDFPIEIDDIKASYKASRRGSMIWWRKLTHKTRKTYNMASQHGVILRPKRALMPGKYALPHVGNMAFKKPEVFIDG